MQMSAEINELAAALSQAQSEIEDAEKVRLNPAFRSKYADLGAIVDACKPALTKHGLAFSQVFEPSQANTLRLTTILLHRSGQWLAGTCEMPLSKQDPQGYGSAATYARRYGLAAIVGVCPEDDDAQSATPKPPTRGERFAAGVRPETPHPESRGDQRARQAVENAEQPLPVKGALPAVESADLIPSLRRDIGEEYKRSGLPPDKTSFWAWLSRAAETQASEWTGLTPAELERALAVIRQYNAAKAGTDRLMPEPEQQPVASGFGRD